MSIDWRLPENRRECFMRVYSFHLKYRSHPGLVYFWLPGIAENMDLDEDQKAWLVWLNGNTQNPVTSLLLLRAAPGPQHWKHAVNYWNDNFKALEWDTDRRHQKSKFGEATEKWWFKYGAEPAKDWSYVGKLGWDDTWKFAKSQPYMGRLSSWSMIEYARILLGHDVPDAATFMLEDRKGSQSHRNGVALIDGWDSTYWDADDVDDLGLLPHLQELAEDLLVEARERNPGHPDVGRLTMESALCVYKSMHKPNRRYPNVYADMAVNRLRRAEDRFGKQFQLLWDLRNTHLPTELRIEDNPSDPGLSPEKQNMYLDTGRVPMIGLDWKDMQ